MSAIPITAITSTTVTSTTVESSSASTSTTNTSTASTHSAQTRPALTDSIARNTSAFNSSTSANIPTRSNGSTWAAGVINALLQGGTDDLSHFVSDVTSSEVDELLVVAESLSENPSVLVVGDDGARVHVYRRCCC